MKKFSSEDLPWMAYGCTKVEGAVTAQEALKLAGLDFDVEFRPAAYQNSKGNWVRHAHRGAIVRTDTDVALSATSDTYEILQYRDAFSFVDSINPEILAAGSLKTNDAAAFIICRVPGHSTLLAANGTDPHDLYVMLRTSHDGSKAIELVTLPLRNKCMNMMNGVGGSIAYDAVNRWSIRHTRNLQVRLDQAAVTIGKLDEFARDYVETSNRLAAIDLELSEARDVLDAVVPQELVSREDRIDSILDTYAHSDVNGFEGTGWGLINAVTEFYDHRGPQRSERARFTRAVDGVSRTMTQAVQRQLLRRG